MSITNPTDILLLVIAVGVAGVAVLMLTVLVAAIYAGRIIGRMEQPLASLGEKLDNVTRALDRFATAATTDIGALGKRVEVLEQAKGV